MHMTVIKNTDWNFKARNKQFSLKATADKASVAITKKQDKNQISV